ncbi:hypothetical protein COL01_11415 [Bacillus thuringiensis]|uniref:hypothetical protein n=1 Tax=Bacillus thuringiensis TaxID=1428 RepID=UPI000BF7BD0F|nr:hypothetical protein [Bacillus thuringiensis]PFV34622.1 hypothetical protein COL01_11415 [Bacillus thuringiensis]
MEQLNSILNTNEKIKLDSQNVLDIQLLDCSTPCQNVINTSGTIRLTAGTSNPSSIIFPVQLNIGDTFPVITDPYYLKLNSTPCDAEASINTSCGIVNCNVVVYQISVIGNLPFYFEFPAEFWPCTGPRTGFRAYLNDVVQLNNVLCYNCDGSLPLLCENGLSLVNGKATLVSIRQDELYIYFDFNVEIILPGC